MRNCVDPSGTSFTVSISPPSSGTGLGGGSTARPDMISRMYPHPPKSDFTADTEIVTARGNYRGVLVSVTPDAVVLEVKMGITRSFSKDEIRRMETLAEGK